MRVLLEGGERDWLLDGPPLARGGEAAIYAVPGEPDLAAKVYHRPTPEHADKLAALLAERPPEAVGGRVSVAWPTARLLGPGGEVVGCLMPRVSNARRVCELFNPRARGRICPLFHYGYLLRAARNLAAAVGALHERGHVIGDLNESNVLVSPRAFVTLVDADSFQITSAGRTFRCGVGRAEYTPPELQGSAFADLDRRPEHDAFALAVLIFQLLMQGLHPFAGRFLGEGEPPPLPERIRAGHWPYALGRDGPFLPVPHAPPWEVLPPPAGELFFRCFEEGHADPGRRPSARAWKEALDAAGAGLAVCPANRQHHYPRGLDQCPWCIVARQQDYDPFPTAEQVQARRVSRSVPDISRPAWPAPADDGVYALDPTDPLPPVAGVAEAAPPVASAGLAEEQGPAAPAARQPSWSSWLAVAAMSALLGVLLVLWRYHAASPAQAASARAPSEPAALPPAEAPRSQPAPAGKAEAVARAQRAWQEAVLNLQQAHLDYQRLLGDYWAKRAAAPRGKEDARTRAARVGLEAQQAVVESRIRIVREKAQLWQEAREALLRKGAD